MYNFFLSLLLPLLLSLHPLEARSLQKKDQIPLERLSDSEVEFLQGYIQALIDSNFYEFNVLVCVSKNREVSLYNLPVEARIRAAIIAFVQDLPDIEKVYVQEDMQGDQSHAYANRLIQEKIGGIWFPESTVLFPPLIADPYNPILSMAYRSGKEITASDLVAVSIGDTFPIFRFIQPTFSCQIDIQAGAWVFFDLDTGHCIDKQWGELLDTDYLVGIPVSFSYKDLSFRCRLYHVSTHLGDEFMVSYPDVKRLNVSYEAIDFIASLNPDGGEVRVYFGPGIVIHSDPSFDMKMFYIQYGFEARFYPVLGFRSNKHGLYGTPFLAFDCQNWQVCHFKFSPTVQFGYEWSKLKNAGRKFRLFGIYHYGNGDGQFFLQRTHYSGVGFSFGF